MLEARIAPPLVAEESIRSHWEVVLMRPMMPVVSVPAARRDQIHGQVMVMRMTIAMATMARMARMAKT